MNGSNKCTEYTFKIIVIGDTNTGKSTFIQRFVFDKFVPCYKPTIGVDFMTKSIHFEENTIVRLQLWDIAGQERFGGMTRVYYKDAVGCLILFDLSNYNTFETVKKWKEDLDNKVQLADGSSIPCLLVGNKSDLSRDTRITNIALNDLVTSGNFTAYCRASTKLNQNVRESVNLLITDIIRRFPTSQLNTNQSRDEIDRSIKIDEYDELKKSKVKCTTC